MQLKPPAQRQQTPGGNNAPFVDTQPPITEDYIKQSQHKKKLQQRRHLLDSERSTSMHEMLQRLERSRHEVHGLQRQFGIEENPFKKRILEGQLGHKTAGTAKIEHSLESSYDPAASGFLGSENRIDSVGSFVTFG